jgi:hypothetical protein
VLCLPNGFFTSGFPAETVCISKLKNSPQKIDGKLPLGENNQQYKNDSLDESNTEHITHLFTCAVMCHENDN